MKPESAVGVASNAVSGVARQATIDTHTFFVGHVGAGFVIVLPPPPMKDSDKASVSLTGSSPAYPVARQTSFAPLLNPYAGHNGAQFLTYPKTTPLLPTVRRTTMLEVGLNNSFKYHSPSDFRLTHHTEVRV